MAAASAAPSAIRVICQPGVPPVTRAWMWAGTGVPGPPPGSGSDSGLVACAYPLATQDVPAAAYPKLRAEFAGSRFPDLRAAGTAYVDLAVALLTARGTDGYETAWFHQRLSAACAKHGR